MDRDLGWWADHMQSCKDCRNARNPSFLCEEGKTVLRSEITALERELGEANDSR